MKVAAMLSGLAAIGLAFFLAGCGVDAQSAPVPLTGQASPGMVTPTVTQRPPMPSSVSTSPALLPSTTVRPADGEPPAPSS